MYDFFVANIWWFTGGWYFPMFIIATILAAYIVYEDSEDIKDTIISSYIITLFSPLIIPVVGVAIIFSPLLIPWFVTRKIILDKKKKKQKIENVKQ